MVDATVITPYFTALPFITKTLPAWTDEYDAQRLASYDLYDDLFDNSTATTQLVLRGSDDKPIYIPSAKRFISTLARYVGRGFGFAVDMETGTGDDQRTQAKQTFGDLFARERILSKFMSGKREWLRRGDWVWYLQADPDKPAGKRISIKTVDPRMYFPIFDDNDPDRLWGASLVEETIVGNDVLALKVQRWLKPDHPEYIERFGENGTDIAYDQVIWDIATWSNPDPLRRTKLQTPVPLKELQGITVVPLYHLRNNEQTGNPFGRSELSGLESVVLGLNQAATDEDLALAMAGLGMYATDGGAPEGGTWELGPNMVVEHGMGTKFERISGVPSVEPSQAHIKYLEDNLYGTAGINDIALGDASTAISDSGVALALKMQPLFDAADEKDQHVKDVFDQMFFDLITWLDIYEGVDLTGVRVYTSISEEDRLPFDRTGEFTEITTLFTDKAITLDYLVKVLNDKFGYDIPDADVKTLNDAAALAVQQDAFASRMMDELGGDGSGSGTGDSSGGFGA